MTQYEEYKNYLAEVERLDSFSQNLLLVAIIALSVSLISLIYSTLKN